MKGIIGAILFMFGLGTAIELVSKGNVNLWYFIGSFIVLGYGLELVIENRMENMKEEIMEEIEKLRR